MNIFDYIIILVLAVLVFFAVRYIVKRKKDGKCVGCSCSNCELCKSKKQ
ncbi:MAG: FeoB-associated Cys-rich membrane protein [Oscillospiraceae bacterium]|nr:FeoB-associated Cys-rich membrane protein [Candidatus Ruminococcus equi]